jgi:hypothetical protein
MGNFYTALGWNIAKENFMEDAGFNGKIRGSVVLQNDAFSDMLQWYI